VGKAFEHVERLDGFGGGAHVMGARAGLGPGDVVGHAAGEQERLLGYQRDLASHASEVEFGQVGAVVAHAAVLRTVEPDGELDQRALA
jgi:hypothetical protein